MTKPKYVIIVKRRSPAERQRESSHNATRSSQAKSDAHPRHTPGPHPTPRPTTSSHDVMGGRRGVGSARRNLKCDHCRSIVRTKARGSMFSTTKNAACYFRNAATRADSTPMCALTWQCPPVNNAAHWPIHERVPQAKNFERAGCKFCYNRPLVSHRRSFG